MSRFETGKKYWYRDECDQIQEVIAFRIDAQTVRFGMDYEIKASEQNNSELVELSENPLVIIWASNAKP
jgi:hypothetical protein